MSSTPAAIAEQTPLNEYPTMIDWLASLNSEDTRKNYTRDIRRLVNFLNSERSLESKLTPDDLVKMSNGELKAVLFKYALHLKKIAKRSVAKPKKGEISVNSLPTMLIGIESFLDYNEVPAPYWKKLIKALPPKVKNHLRGYMHEEIGKMMKLGVGCGKG
jgi:hypothetical protein